MSYNVVHDNVAFESETKGSFRSLSDYEIEPSDEEVNVVEPSKAKSKTKKSHRKDNGHVEQFSNGVKEEKINDFATRIHKEHGNGFQRQSSVRMSKRRVPDNFVVEDDVASNAADKIMHRGDAVRLTWKGVTVKTLPKTSFMGNTRGKEVIPPKTILEDISGGVEPGTLLAIMGSSGAGKSTFLNMLTYRNRQNLDIAGEIKVNGVELGQHITNVSAYVQQDDLFVGAVTVKEHLMFTANLRMKSSTTHEQKHKRVEEVMIQMGLKKVEDVIIGTADATKTISGGEKKRLSFAAELLTNPPLMFCDEPTSGLDSYLAQILCESLRNIAKQGCTVLCTIHQPSSEVFELFDNLLLLALGKVVFMGKSRDAMKFYNSIGYPCPQNYNPADHYISEVSVVPGREQECREKIHEITESFKETNYAAEMRKITEEPVENSPVVLSEVAIPKSPYRVNFWTQFWTCFKRELIKNYRNPLVLRVRIAQTVCVSLLVGLVYLRPYGSPYTSDEVFDVSGSLFLVIINLSFAYTFGVVNVFPAEIPLFRREHFNGMYSNHAYFAAKNLAELPMYIFLPLLYDVIVYFMFGLYPDAKHFFVFYAITLLLVSTCVSFGYMVSTMSPSVTVALSIAPPMMIPLLLFGGFFISADSIPVYFLWLKYMSWFLYSNEMLTINQWQDVDEIICTNQATPPSPTLPSIANITDITSYFNVTSLPELTSTICPSPEINTCVFETGTDVIHAFAFNEDYMGRDVGLMFALLIGYRLISYLVLVWRMRDSSR